MDRLCLNAQCSLMTATTRPTPYFYYFFGDEMFCHCRRKCRYFYKTHGGQGGTIPRAANYCAGAKSSNNVMSTFFKTVHLVPKTSGWNMGWQTWFMLQVPSNLVTPLHDAHQDCLAKTAKLVYTNTLPSVANYQSQNL